MDGCIEWQKSCSGSGYGQIKVGGRKGKLWRAHRWSWVQVHGPIPEGLCVLHRCDNRRCVNVDHLFLGTMADNSADMWAKGRGWTPGLRGSAHPLAKLDEVKVRMIRREHAAGASIKELAARYGVGSPNICHITSGRTWKGVV